MPEEVTVSMPLQLTPDLICAVHDHHMTSVPDLDEWHKRLGWLICVWDVLVAKQIEVSQQRQSPNPQ